MGNGVIIHQDWNPQAGETMTAYGRAHAGGAGYGASVSLALHVASGGVTCSDLSLRFESPDALDAFAAAVVKAAGRARSEFEVITGVYEPPFPPGDAAPAAGVGPRFDDPEFGPDRPVEGGR